MVILLTVLGGYLLLGIVVLGLFDWLTGRVRKRLREASSETQERLNATGNITGAKTAALLTVLALWMFWPVAIYGALSTLGDKGNDDIL